MELWLVSMVAAGFNLQQNHHDGPGMTGLLILFGLGLYVCIVVTNSLGTVGIKLNVAFYIQMQFKNFLELQNALNRLFVKSIKCQNNV